MYIIEYQGYFFDGVLWTKNKSKAKQYKSIKQAWKYIDHHFEDTEDYSLERV